MWNPRVRGRRNLVIVSILLSMAAILLWGCTPSPEANVIAHLVAKNLGTYNLEPDRRPPGNLEGSVYDADGPLEGAAVVVSERYGTTHHAYTDAEGRYHIEGIPPGQYTPAAVAPNHDAAVPEGMFGVPQLVTIESEQTTEAPLITLEPHVAKPLPNPLAESVKLTATGEYTATSPFPSGSVANVTAYSFEYDGVVNDWLRVYVPEGTAANEALPMLLAVYPGPTPNWEVISVALADGGYTVVAISPNSERGMDIDGHAMDARIALNLALEGELGPHIAGEQAVALGGSFSSPVLRRMLLDEPDTVSSWIVLGGISDGYGLANDFYEDRINLPSMHNLAIPALGMPNLYPLPFLHYSSIYSAAELPPTLINHTVNDDITLVDQAYRLEAALKDAGVPVEAFYYDDESHYLQLGEYTPESSKEMYRRVLEFIEEDSGE